MVCEWCSKEFERSDRPNSKKSFCSSDCYRAWYHKNNEKYKEYKSLYSKKKKAEELLEKGIDVHSLYCKLCGELIIQPRKGKYKLNFCSKKCSAIFRRNEPGYKEYKRKYDSDYKKKNREKIRDNQKKYNSSELNLYKSRIKLIEKYGLTEDSYKLLEEKQKGCCAICKTSLDNPCIDHCHKTGEVRGLLCNKCNTAIGLLEDEVEILFNAYKYLIFNEK